MDITLGAANAALIHLSSKSPIIPLLDPLSHGPIRPFSIQSVERWVSRRLSYWAGVYSLETDEIAKRESAYLDAIERILNSKDLIVWSNSDVDGLLLTAWVAFLLHAHKANCQVEMVQFSRRWGTCMPPVPMKVAPRPILIVGKDAEFLISLWRAWTSSSPHLLLELFAKSSRRHSRRFLLSRLLNRYPSAKTGLTRWDEKLLRNVRKHGPRLRMVLAHTLGDSWHEFDCVGDRWLQSRLRRLAHSSKKRPLVAIHQHVHRPLHNEVTLTQLGSEVLAGQANAWDSALETDWIGGVRIDKSKPDVWVRTADGLAVYRR